MPRYIGTLLLFAICASASFAQAQPPVRAPVRAAFFGVKLIDTSLNAEHEAENRRIALLEERVKSTLSTRAGYVFVDTAPVADKMHLYSNMAHCNGCDSQLARALGADVAVTGEVQKTSNLILSMTIYIRDSQTGKLVRGGSADIRGNTDTSWERGINWLLEHRILEQ